MVAERLCTHVLHIRSRDIRIIIQFYAQYLNFTSAPKHQNTKTFHLNIQLVASGSCSSPTFPYGLDVLLLGYRILVCSAVPWLPHGCPA